MGGDKVHGRHTFASLEELKEWFYGITHKDLYNINLKDNPVVQKNPIPPLKPDNYEPVYQGEKPVVARNIRATIYADERDGTRWDGRPTTIETIYDTREPTAAINSSLYGKFPLGSVIEVSFTNTKDGVTSSTLVRITDYKRGEGTDLSFAAGGDFGFEGGGKVSLQLYKELGCKFNASNPFKCADEQVSIIWKTSKWTVPGRKYDRDSKDIKDFRLLKYSLTHIFQKLGSLAETPMFIRLSRIDADHDPLAHFNIFSGYFRDLESAGLYLFNVCGPNSDISEQLTNKEAKILKNTCDEAVVDVRPFPKRAYGIFYAKKGTRYKGMDIAKLWFDSKMPDQALSDLYFDYAQLTFKSKLDADIFRSRFANSGNMVFVKNEKEGSSLYRFERKTTLTTDEIDDLALAIMDAGDSGSEESLGFKYSFSLNEENRKYAENSLG